MRWVARAAVGAVVALLVAQLVPASRGNPPVVRALNAPAPVAAILRRACYDCHSNETVWPWYSRVAPLSWLIAHDVAEGRSELNFSDWPPRLDDKDFDELLEELEEKVSEREMPPWEYLLMHPEVDLDHEARTVLRAWAAQLRTTLDASGGHRQRRRRRGRS